MAYSVELSPAAVRQLRKLSEPARKQVGKAIDKIAESPRRRGVKKLAGTEDLYRFRVGDYRVVFTVEGEKLIVVVVKIGDRKEVYR